MEETKTPTQIMRYIANAYNNNVSREEIIALYATLPDKDAISDDYGQPLIHIAARFADPQAIEYLLENGARAGAKNRYQETALHALAKCGEGSRAEYNEDDIKKCAGILLGARVSALMRDDGAGGNLCYHAALKGKPCLSFLYAMMDNKVKLDMLDKDGRNVLHLIACYPAKSAQHSIRYCNREEGKEEYLKELEECFVLAQALIEYGIDPQAKDQSGKSPADYAVLYELNKLAVLFNGEYDPSDASLEDRIISGGKTLHEAAETNDLAALEALIRLGADVNELNTTPYHNHLNQTPLAIAAYKLNLECVKVLIEAGADVNFRGGESDRTAFYWFANKIQNYSGEHKKNNTIGKILKMFFDAGLDPDGATDEKGNTPLNLVCAGGSYNEELRREILDLGVGDYNLPDKNGVTPLMNIVRERWNSPENDLIVLLERGADMAAPDSQGNTALIYAVQNNSQSIAMTLVDLMFSFGDPVPDAVNNEGKTAMDYAVNLENENLIKFLLSKM